MKVILLGCLFFLHTETAAAQNKTLREGKHPITCQWISWDKPGTVIIKKMSEGVYSVKGNQKMGSQYVTIDGTLAPKTARQLIFNGTITCLCTGNNNDQPCVREGEQEFLSTGTRKYWRLQNMLNCDGVVTDYIDIYF
jgi:hypothetical protein